MNPLADESALMNELRGLAEQGRQRAVLDRLHALPASTLESRTALTLLAAEAHGRLGEHAEAERWAVLALTIARGRTEPQAAMRALNALGIIAVRRADVAHAEERFGEALEAARMLQDSAMQARCLNNLGVLATLRGDPEAALGNYQLALAAYQQAGLTRGIAETYHNIGIAWYARGQHREALGAADQSVRLAALTKDDSLLGLALTGRAEIHLAAGDEDLAAAELERAAEAYTRVGLDAGLPEVWRLQAAVARRRGDLARARALLERGAEPAASASAESLAQIHRDLGAVLEATGDTAGARAARARARGLYAGLGATKAAAEMAALLG
jgi:tetratricopeptide (TPR) repeat protein